MTDPIQPQWPLEATPWPAREYIRRALDQNLMHFHDQPWHRDAVRSSGKFLSNVFDNEGPADQIASLVRLDALSEFLRAERLDDAAKAIQPSTSDDIPYSSEPTLYSIMLAEASALALSETISPARWSLACRLVADNVVSAPVFFDELSSYVRTDDRFAVAFGQVADGLFTAAVSDPFSRIRSKRERSELKALVEQWRKRPQLRDVWFGLRGMRPTFPDPDIDCIVTIYLRVDPQRASALISRFENPYQIWLTIAGFSSLALNHSFSAWSSLLKHAPASFTATGSWTGESYALLLLVIAQDALAEASSPDERDREPIIGRDAEFERLTSSIASLIGDRPDASGMSLRWAAWLFRLTLMSVASDRPPFPADLRQRATCYWRMVEALAKSPIAQTWKSVAVPDGEPEMTLCLLAVKTITTLYNGENLPDLMALFEAIPVDPAEFLGRANRDVRERTSLFTTFGQRPQAFGYRVLANLFVGNDAAARYQSLWKRTLVLRELCEHWQYAGGNDGRDEAKRVLTFVLALGLAAFDLCIESLAKGEEKCARAVAIDLFALVYENLRELRAIEPFNHDFWSECTAHLVVRRALFEDNKEPRTGVHFSLFSACDSPTLESMLGDIAGVSQEFLTTLDTLVGNGVPTPRVLAALDAAQIDLQMLLDSVGRYNEANSRRPLRALKAPELLRSI